MLFVGAPVLPRSLPSWRPVPFLAKADGARLCEFAPPRREFTPAMRAGAAQPRPKPLSLLLLHPATSYPQSRARDVPQRRGPGEGRFRALAPREGGLGSVARG